MIDQIRSRARALLTSERGDYMAQQIVGAVVSLLVMGGVTTGILSTVAIQSTIVSRAVVTQQGTSTETALRSDVKWASVILPGDAEGAHADTVVRFIIPGRDSRCQESTWRLRPGTDGNTELVNQVANYDTYDTSVTPVTCTGTRQLNTEQVMISAADPDARFEYYNPGGRQFELIGEAKTLLGDTGRPQLSSEDPKAAEVTQLDWDSQAVKTVGLTTTVGTGSDLQTDYVFRETASNLHKAPAAPASREGDPVDRYFQDHASLLG